MVHIEFSSDSFQINSVAVQFPVSIGALKEIISPECREHKGKNNTLFVWDDLGIIAYTSNGELVNSLGFELEISTYDFSPKAVFSGTFNFSGEDIIEYYKTHENERVITFKGDDSGALVQNGLSAWFSVRKDVIQAIEVSLYKPYVRGEGIAADKYTIKPIDEEEIEFVDFGFKLSIIEELMYMKGLLKPKFDLYEFADWYKGREIDIDEEGYEPIAEVTQYFKDLPIPKRLAPEITEIYQDGGNDIYMNLSPFSGGAVEYWDIECSDDIKHFPNLKKATLCYAQEPICDELIILGVDAEWI
ncbi:DUF6892 domain-containing protein [Maribacter ulvicola]|uniref:Uncharacterized protein n=1 Tax=Maribacter ulvicola TaxID=228959 RepID=A0A1N6RP66_9FLAO|nr:hypothetical protein [Maribacter ulvicola]SIQ30678.1 hypothetical protein SAMN05421797_1011354 [Maribacter ulvicola]